MKKGVSLVLIILALCMASPAGALEFAVRAPAAQPVIADALPSSLAAGRSLPTGVTLAALTPDEQDALRALGYEVFVPAPLYTALAESVPQVRADEAWTAALDAPVRGGTTVCVIDTGVNYDHELLGGGGFPNGKVIGGTDVYNNDSDPRDDNGHGSHVSATAVGNGTLPGVAPGARLVHVKALGSDGTGNFEYLAAAIRWCTAHRDDYNITVISMSLSDGGTYTAASCPTREDAAYQSTEDALAAASDAGLMLVASSGNDGSTVGITYPACNPQVISVGSVGDGSSTPGVGGCRESYTRRDVISGFTNTNRLLDLLAPGACITAAGMTGDELVDKGGTSMATPHVAGALLLLMDLEHQLGITEQRGERLQLLKDTGPRIARDDDSWPRIDVMAALERLLPEHLAFPPVAFCTACTIHGTLTNTHENATGLNETNITLVVHSDAPARLLVDGEEVNGTNNTFLIRGLPPLVTRELTLILNSTGERISLTTDTGGLRKHNSTVTETIELLAPDDNATTPGRFSYRVRGPDDAPHDCTLYLNGTAANESTVRANENVTVTLNCTGNVTWNVSCTRDGVTGWSETRRAHSDTTPPRITAALNQSFFRSNDTARLNITVIDESNVTVVTITRLTRNGSRWNGTPIINTSSFLINATDLAGNTAVFNMSNYTLDDTPPLIWALQPRASRSANVTFTWRVNDSTPTSCTHAVGNETPVPANRSRTVELDEGNHSWTVNCTDAVGWTSSAHSWTLVDLTDPVIEDCSLSDDIVQPGTPVQLRFRVHDTLGLKRVSADNTTLHSDNDSYEHTLTKNETTTILINATDHAGRSTTEERVLVIDGDAPRLALALTNESLDNRSIVTSTPLRINWTSNDTHPGNTSLWLDDTLLDSSNATRGEEDAATLPGPRTLRLTSEDAAGNTATLRKDLIANTTINTTALEEELERMLDLDVTLRRDGQALRERDHLDGRITLILSRSGAQLTMYFSGLDARWGDPWNVTNTTPDCDDEQLDSFALTLGNFLDPAQLELRVWFNTTNGTHVVAINGNETVTLPPCAGNCSGDYYNRTADGSLAAHGESFTGFIALRDTTPPHIQSVEPPSASGSSPLTVTLTLTTTSAATCRFGTTNAAFDSLTPMTDAGTTHTTTRRYTTSTTETLFFACQDEYGNEERKTHSLAVTIQQPRRGGGGGGGGGGYFRRPTPPQNATKPNRTINRTPRHAPSTFRNDSSCSAPEVRAPEATPTINESAEEAVFGELLSPLPAQTASLPAPRTSLLTGAVVGVTGGVGVVALLVLLGALGLVLRRRS